MDEVLDADDAMLAQVGLDDVVVRDRDALALDLGEAALVDDLLDRLKVGVAGQWNRGVRCQRCGFCEGAFLRRVDMWWWWWRCGGAQTVRSARTNASVVLKRDSRASPHASVFADY